MHFVFPSVLAFVAFVAAQADPSITTPAQLVQCQPAQISWTATKTPVFVSIIPGGQVGAAALEDFGQQTGSSLTWNVDIAANTQITFQIRDSSGVTAYSAPVSIQGSSDSSCIGQGSSSAAGGSTAGPSSTAAVPSSVSASVSSVASSAVASASSSFEASTSSVVASASSVIESATSTRPATSASSTRSASATSASASASASAAPNAARSNAQVGFAGLLGLVAAAFMA